MQWLFFEAVLLPLDLVAKGVVWTYRSYCEMLGFEYTDKLPDKRHIPPMPHCGFAHDEMEMMKDDEARKERGVSWFHIERLRDQHSDLIAEERDKDLFYNAWRSERHINAYLT
jgi:hypothetical protein